MSSSLIAGPNFVNSFSHQKGDRAHAHRIHHRSGCWLDRCIVLLVFPHWSTHRRAQMRTQYAPHAEGRIYTVFGRRVRGRITKTIPYRHIVRETDRPRCQNAMPCVRECLKKQDDDGADTDTDLRLSSLHCEIRGERPQHGAVGKGMCCSRKRIMHASRASRKTRNRAPASPCSPARQA